MSVSLKTRAISNVTKGMLLLTVLCIILGINSLLFLDNFIHPEDLGSSTIYAINIFSILLLFVVIALTSNLMPTRYFQYSFFMSFLFVVTGTALGTVLILSAVTSFSAFPDNGRIILVSSMLEIAIFIYYIYLRDHSWQYYQVFSCYGVYKAYLARRVLMRVIST